MTETAAREEDAGGRLRKTVRDGESLAIMLASPIHGRAIDRCVTKNNIARNDLCALTDRLRHAKGARNALELSQPVGLLIMFLNPKTKEKERADPVWDKTVPLDSDGCHNDPKEGSRESQARDRAIRSATRHPSRGVESLSNQGERDEEKMCSIPGIELDSTGLPQVLCERPGSYSKHSLPDGVRPQARKRGMTRAKTNKEPRAAVERSLAARVTFIVFAIVVRLVFAIDSVS
jgi:hypothetical protein